MRRWIPSLLGILLGVVLVARQQGWANEVSSVCFLIAILLYTLGAMLKEHKASKR